MTPSSSLPDELLALAGDRCCVLHGSGVSDDGGSPGGDLDCAVHRLDPTWPLRLPAPWRLVQSVRYDVTGWCWTLEGNGRQVVLDTLDDARGLGREGFPTGLLFGELGPHPGARAAYLVAKRLRKRVTDAAEWQSIGRLATTDPDGLVHGLRTIFGASLARRLGDTTLRGAPPPPSLRRRALAAQQLRRVRSPSRFTAVTAGQAGRLLRRALRPAGLLVVVVGPDGSGKSTIALQLLETCRAPFRGRLHLHWRPGLLPAPGSLLGWAGRRQLPDVTSPHARAPFGRVLSRLLLGYYWLDNLLGSWLWLWPARVRNSLIVVERGWFDIAVDPRRYRLQVTPRAVQRLGRLLPKPDLVLVLHGEPSLLTRRKNELAEREIERQLHQWSRVLPAGVRSVVVDVGPHPPAVLAATRAAVLRLLEERAADRLGAGWANLPRTAPRWWLPRHPGPVAAGALKIYQPVTRRALVPWKAAAVLARLGGLRFLRSGSAPPRDVRERLAPYLLAGDHLAVMRSNTANRYMALILDRRGRPRAFGKLALDEWGRRALEHEAAAIARLGRLLVPPLRAPEIIGEEPGLLLTRAEDWIVRRRSWRMSTEVAAALGTFFRVSRHAAHSDGRGAAHGDCAPWNLLRTPTGWVLLDWEHARDDAPPFYDLFHFLVQAHALLRRVSRLALLDGLSGRGWVGDLLRAYAGASGLPIDQAPTHFGTYLAESQATLDPDRADRQAGLDVRRDLQARVESWQPPR
jgi:hypothetical protein